MKQCITKEQWDELSDEQKFEFIVSEGWYSEGLVEKVRDNVDPPLLKSLVEHFENTMTLPTIGQMIEFIESGLTESKFTWCDFIDWDYNGEFCDDLWRVVKGLIKEKPKCSTCGKHLNIN